MLVRYVDWQIKCAEDTHSMLNNLAKRLLLTGRNEGCGQYT
jgi:hypothetical protein